MNPIVKNVLAVIAGAVIGIIINGSIINFGPMLIPPPDGVDTTTTEGLKEAIHLLQPKHYITPFLAHAIGTLVGAIVTALLAANKKKAYAIAIGFFFLLGGIAASFMIPAPGWFIAVDLIFAYIPMGWLGYKVYTKFAN